VIVPTFGRPARIRNLLLHLAEQTLDPASFEVIVADDGTDPPIAVDDPLPYRFELVRQANAGPGAARNLALARCRADLTLILNDDVVPARDLCEKHVALHAELKRAGREKLACLGTFHFTREARESAFTQLLDRSDLLFDFSPLVDGNVYGWAFFWTCNISLPTAALREVGGFDARTFYDIVEDCELGYRLEQRGWRVLYRADLVAHHDHVLEPQGFFGRTRRLGRGLARMFKKHGDPTILRQKSGTEIDGAVLRQCLSTYELLAPKVESVEAMLALVEASERGKELAPELVAKLAAAVARVNAAPFCRGVLEEMLGHDPERVRTAGPPAGELTSVIVLSHGAQGVTRRCLAALRSAQDERHPMEILVVDNGSQDGSREFLTAQPDVQLIANDRNAGAPHARNQAIAKARGSWIVFLDNDAIVTPGWLARLLYHAAIDPLAACIGPTSDRAAHGQAIAYAGSSEAGELARFADAIAREKHRQFKFASLLSSFCLLVRRSVVDAIGGFDERFTPWGFEDDDYTLRAALLGFHNRIALDVFVRHEGYAGPKLDAHERLLDRNWGRFRAKWKLPAGAARGDYAGLAPRLGEQHAPSALHLPLQGQGQGQSFEDEAERRRAPTRV
jgi:GT2 family glycosyltransferase